MWGVLFEICLAFEQQQQQQPKSATQIMAELMQCESKIIAKGGGDISIVCGNSFGGEGGDDATDDTIGKVNVESFNSADTEVGVRTNHPNQVTGFDSTRDFLRQFVAERNWDQFHTPVNVLLAMMGEVGELCEIFQWIGCVTDISGFDAAKITHLGEEISDVFIYNARLADLCGLDLAPAVRNLLALRGTTTSGSIHLEGADTSGEQSRQDMSFEECSRALTEDHLNNEFTGDDSFTATAPRHVVLRVAATAGSLCSLVLQRPESQSPRGLPSWPAADALALSSGVAAVACHLTQLAVLAGLDIGECVRDKFGKNVAKYPAHLVQGSSAKYTAYTEAIRQQQQTTTKPGNVNQPSNY